MNVLYSFAEFDLWEWCERGHLSYVDLGFMTLAFISLIFNFMKYVLFPKNYNLNTCTF